MELRGSQWTGNENIWFLKPEQVKECLTLQQQNSLQVHSNNQHINQDIRSTPSLMYLYKYTYTHQCCCFNINVSICFTVLHSDVYFCDSSGTCLGSAENLVLNHLVLIALFVNRYHLVIFPALFLVYSFFGVRTEV